MYVEFRHGMCLPWGNDRNSFHLGTLETPRGRRMYLAALALGAALAFSPPGCGLDRAPPVAKARRQQLLRMGEPGTEVDPETIGWEERQWKKRKDTPVTDDGACFVISEEEAPEYAARGQPCRGTASIQRVTFPVLAHVRNPSKQWFFCSDPADDEAIECELVGTRSGVYSL